MTQLYYTAPTDEVFNEVKERAIDLWFTLGSEPSYAREKISRIENIGNVQDNVMYMVAMFDANNQRKLANLLSEEARKAIRERMVDGGNPSYSIPF